MKHVLLVGIGGGLGAIARFLLGSWILHRTVNWQFPLGTFVVNVLGCLIAGVLWGAAERRELLSADLRLFLFTGILGGFTTFSAFGVETVTLMRKEAYGVAALNVALSIVCGMAMLWLAIVLFGHSKN